MTGLHSVSDIFCTACSEGKYQSASGASACIACPAGSMCVKRATSPALCAPGTVARGPLGSECEPCNAGTYQSGSGRTLCEACPAGFYCEERAGAPTACDEGSYRYSVGATSSADCAPCPPGSACATGATMPMVCAPGSYAAPGDVAISSSPVGTGSGDAGSWEEDGSGPFDLSGSSWVELEGELDGELAIFENSPELWAHLLPHPHPAGRESGLAILRNSRDRAGGWRPFWSKLPQSLLQGAHGQPVGCIVGCSLAV